MKSFFLTEISGNVCLVKLKLNSDMGPGFFEILKEKSRICKNPCEVSKEIRFCFEIEITNISLRQTFLLVKNHLNEPYN